MGSAVSTWVVSKTKEYFFLSPLTCHGMGNSTSIILLHLLGLGLFISLNGDTRVYWAGKRDFSPNKVAAKNLPDGDRFFSPVSFLFSRQDGSSFELDILRLSELRAIVLIEHSIRLKFPPCQIHIWHICWQDRACLGATFFLHSPPLLHATAANVKIFYFSSSLKPSLGVDVSMFLSLSLSLFFAKDNRGYIIPLDSLTTYFTDTII